MADKTLEYLLRLNASSAVAGLRSATDASTALATAERAEATAALAANRAHAGASTAMGRASVSAGQLSSGLSNLGSQAADVGVQLAMGMNPIMIMVQQGPQIAGAITQLGGLGSAWKALGGVVTAAAPALTAASGALAAVGVVYMEITGIIGDYTAATDAAKEANESFTAALRPLNEALESARDRQAVLRGALGSNDPKAYLAIADISAQADKKQADATKELREERDLLLTQYGLMGNEGSTLAIQTMARVKEIDKEIAVVHEQADAWASAATVNYTLQAAIDKTTEARERSTAAIVKEDAALKAFMDDVERSRMSGMNTGLEKWETFSGLGQQAAAVEAERAKKARDEWIDIAIDVGAMMAEQFNETVDVKPKGGVFSEGNLSWFNAAQDPQALMQKAAGDSVQGGWIMAIVNAVANFDTTVDKFADYHEKIMGQIGNFWGTIGSNLKSKLVDGSQQAMDGVANFFQGFADNFDDIIQGLFEAIPQIFGMLLKLIFQQLPNAVWSIVKAVFDMSMWASAIKALVQGFVTAIGDAIKSIVQGKDNQGIFVKGGGWWDRAGDAVGDAVLGKNRQGVLSDIWRGPQGEGGIKGLVGSFDSGGYIPRTGLAMVHRGEYVSTSAETSRGQRRTSDGTGAGVTNVNIGPVYGGREAARQIADLLREHMGSNGQRLTIQGA